MSPTRGAAHTDPGNARIIEERNIAGPQGEDEIEAIEDRGRRWYHPRPQPRRRSDLMGINSTWWMAVLWLVVIVLIVFPFPGWW